MSNHFKDEDMINCKHKSECGNYVERLFEHCFLCFHNLNNTIKLKDNFKPKEKK